MLNQDAHARTNATKKLKLRLAPVALSTTVTVSVDGVVDAVSPKLDQKASRVRCLGLKPDSKLHKDGFGSRASWLQSNMRAILYLSCVHLLTLRTFDAVATLKVVRLPVVVVPTGAPPSQKVGSGAVARSIMVTHSVDGAADV